MVLIICQDQPEMINNITYTTTPLNQWLAHIFPLPNLNPCVASMYSLHSSEVEFPSRLYELRKQTTSEKYLHVNYVD